MRTLRTRLLLCGIAFLTLTSSCRKGDLTPRPNQPHNIRGVANYRKAFPDVNDTHLQAAAAVGISPIADRRTADSLTDELTRVEDNDWYVVDTLTYSIPYLVRRADTLLADIGRNFSDSLEAKGLNPNLLIVTSVLRTRQDVRRLRRRNGNASENSAHCYGATFDISWKRFRKVEKDNEGHPFQDVAPDTLKRVLSEVLRDLRQEGRCYVKHELNQACFHITAR